MALSLQQNPESTVAEKGRPKLANFANILVSSGNQAAHLTCNFVTWKDNH